MIYGSSSRLVVKRQRQTCNTYSTPLGPLQQCSEKEVCAIKEYGVRMHPTNTYCSIDYDRSSFELEQAGDTDFRPASMAGASL